MPKQTRQFLFMFVGGVFVQGFLQLSLSFKIELLVSTFGFASLLPKFIRAADDIHKRGFCHLQSLKRIPAAGGSRGGRRGHVVTLDPLQQCGFETRSGGTSQSCRAKRICVGFCDRTQCTTIKSGHIGLWTKMRRSGGRFSGPESSLQFRSLADFITTTSECRFSVRTGRRVRLWRTRDTVAQCRALSNTSPQGHFLRRLLGLPGASSFKTPT